MNNEDRLNLIETDVRGGYRSATVGDVIELVKEIERLREELAGSEAERERLKAELISYWPAVPEYAAQWCLHGGFKKAAAFIRQHAEHLGRDVKTIERRIDEATAPLKVEIERLKTGLRAKCTHVIPGTFVACGEGGNYCSDLCWVAGGCGEPTGSGVAEGMANKVKPIKPAEVEKARAASIPDEVFEAFNELIVKNWDGGEAYVVQADAAKLIAQKTNQSTNVVYNNHWLDVEPHYRKAGWTVKYDKPGYNESGEAHFIFSKKRSG